MVTWLGLGLGLGLGSGSGLGLGLGVRLTPGDDRAVVLERGEGGLGRDHLLDETVELVGHGRGVAARGGVSPGDDLARACAVFTAARHGGEGILGRDDGRDGSDLGEAVAWLGVGAGVGIGLGVGVGVWVGVGVGLGLGLR